MNISSTKVSLNSQLRPHLPKQSSAQGQTADRLAQACEEFIGDVRAGRTPSMDPYSSQLSNSGKVKLSGELKSLAQNAQADFAAQAETAGASLRLPQLESSLQSLQEQTQLEIGKLSSEKKDLKSDYRKQVAQTIGWMAGTAGALVVGGILPNPISVVGVGIMATCTIRSIGKSRAAQKNLAQKLPAIQQGLEASRHVLAQTVSYGPAVAAWESALGSQSQTLAA
jgi:hypothetical protein